MKALVKKFDKQGIWMDEVDKPIIKDDEVLIKIKKTAICGTDIHIYNWDEWAQNTIKIPTVIGHEYVGEIVEAGKNVTNAKVGDIVTGEGHIVCGKCRHCLDGNQHLCPNTYGIGVNIDGAFAQYLALPAKNVWHTNPNLDIDLYSIFDPFGNAVHTALEFDVIGEDVLVTGAGPIGIMAAVVAKNNGARNVVITDLNQYRLDLAKNLGIENAYNPNETSYQEIMEKLGMSEGFDVGLEMSGNVHAFNAMIDSMANGGKIAILGLVPDGVSVAWSKVIFKSLTLKGIYGRKMYDTWYKMQALIEGGLDISSIITHHFPVDEYEQAFELMASGQSGKIILDWEK